MYDEYDRLARVHVYDKCSQIDITWSEVEAMLDAAKVIEEHAFDDLMVYIPTLDEWKPGFRERRK